jgi:hypothetical protein
MYRLLRRIRGATGIAITWAFAWSFVGSIPRWVFGFKPDAPLPLIFGVLGLLAGLAFSGVLILAEGRRPLERLSIPRFAAWGAIGGVLLSAVFTRMASLSAADAAMIVPTFAAASALCAAGSLALARRGEAPALGPHQVSPRLSEEQRELFDLPMK